MDKAQMPYNVGLFKNRMLSSPHRYPSMSRFEQGPTEQLLNNAKINCVWVCRAQLDSGKMKAIFNNWRGTHVPNLPLKQSTISDVA
jgi:hypothetical protein